jgi:hypothetical protein
MSPLTFIGVNVSPGRPPFTLAALDGERKLVALSQGPLAEMLAYASGQSEAIIAISAPYRPNQGQASLQAPLPAVEGLPARRQANLRVAEQELLQRGIRIPHTPGQPEHCPVWMQRGFVFYEQLESAGYQDYRQKNAPRVWLETHAEAGFHNLLGLAPFTQGTLEGRIQRQLLLRNEELPVKDPMNFFEEVTRHRLLHGILPAENIHPQNELNALLAAHTAWLAAVHPERLETFGDAAEGCLYLPKPKER